MEMPSVVTTVMVKGTNFTFHVQAYRKLTDAEMKDALKMWLAQKKIRKVPMSGEGKFIAIHGFDT